MDKKDFQIIYVIVIQKSTSEVMLKSASLILRNQNYYHFRL